MGLGRIIGTLLRYKMASTAERRLRTGFGSGAGAGGFDSLLDSVLKRGSARGAGASGGDLGKLAKDFFGGKQAGGMSGAQIGGAGALAGALFGGGLGGAARGGALAVLGTLALKAWREQQAQAGTSQGMAAGAAAKDEATDEEAEAVTSPETERLVLRAMIGAAQADGRIDDAEMTRILGHLGREDATEAEIAEARAEAAKPVDVEAIGRAVTRPEVGTEVYLAALLAVEVESEAERDYLRRLAAALKLEPALVRRLHRMTGAPEA